MATFVSEGHQIDHTPSADVAAGAVVVFGELVGVAKQPIASGKLGALAITGIFDVAKEAPLVISAGDSLYWTGNNVNKTSANNTYLGTAVADAANNATLVRAAINI